MRSAVVRSSLRATSGESLKAQLGRQRSDSPVVRSDRDGVSIGAVAVRIGRSAAWLRTRVKKGDVDSFRMRPEGPPLIPTEEVERITREFGLPALKQDEGRHHRSWTSPKALGHRMSIAPGFISNLIERGLIKAAVETIGGRRFAKIAHAEAARFEGWWALRFPEWAQEGKE